MAWALAGITHWLRSAGVRSPHTLVVEDALRDHQRTLLRIRLLTVTALDEVARDLGSKGASE